MLLLQTMTTNQALVLILAFLHTSYGCPIPTSTGCSNLTNISQYIRESPQQELLQLAVNISTTQGQTFRPQLFQLTLSAANMMHVRTPVIDGCAGMFNYTSQSAGVDSPCPWRYQCDYNPQRIPAFFFSARCNSATPQGSGLSGVCEEVHYPINYIMTGSCDPLGDSLNNEWSLQTTVLPVSCNLQDGSVQF